MVLPIQKYGGYRWFSSITVNSNTSQQKEDKGTELGPNIPHIWAG